MRFFERPGKFVDVIIPQIVQKEKRQTRKPAASMRFREKTHPIEITISHIKHFVNAFEPVAYRRPAVMHLRCNVRQWKPLNVPQ
jgi:hypothetical protein